jgi:hypothetical protein
LFETVPGMKEKQRGQCAGRNRPRHGSICIGEASEFVGRLCQGKWQPARGTEPKLSHAQVSAGCQGGSALVRAGGAGSRVRRATHGSGRRFQGSGQVAHKGLVFARMAEKDGDHGGEYASLTVLGNGRKNKGRLL